MGSCVSGPRLRGHRRAWFALLVIVAPLGAQRPAALERLHEAARLAAPALVRLRAERAVAEAAVAAAAPAAPLTLELETEGVPDGIRLDRAQQLRLMAVRDFPGGAARRAARDLADAERERVVRRLALADAAVIAAVERDAAAWRIALRIRERQDAADSLLTAVEATLRARFAAGDARYVDVLRLRTERLRAATERARTGARAAAAREALLGLTADTPAVRAALDALAADTLWFTVLPESAPATGSEGLDALLAADLAAADAAVARARGDARPQWSGGIGLQRFQDGDRFTLGPAVMVGVTLPGTARGATAARIALAEAEREAHRAANAATRAEVRTARVRAQAAYEAARHRVAAFDATLLLGARAERDAALDAYAAGRLTLLELLDFERALLGAELERLEALADARNALAAIAAAAAGVAPEEPSHD